MVGEDVLNSARVCRVGSAVARGRAPGAYVTGPAGCVG